MSTMSFAEAGRVLAPDNGPYADRALGSVVFEDQSYVETLLDDLSASPAQRTAAVILLKQITGVDPSASKPVPENANSNERRCATPTAVVKDLLLSVAAEQSRLPPDVHFSGYAPITCLFGGYTVRLRVSAKGDSTFELRHSSMPTRVAVRPLMLSEFVSFTKNPSSPLLVDYAKRLLPPNFATLFPIHVAYDRNGRMLPGSDPRAARFEEHEDTEFVLGGKKVRFKPESDD